jgi:hypothetical protein
MDDGVHRQPYVLKLAGSKSSGGVISVRPLVWLSDPEVHSWIVADRRLGEPALAPLGCASRKSISMCG